MAKQTFSVGQTLTAAQMTSLQQTAMLGGAASAKTASYTLVAADAGGAISMSNASATTITVNTGLFAAGDTVQITNLGAGVCTITAGTATVNSSASLALAQYESGTLDFTSTSAAIFIKGAGAAAASGGMTLLSTTTLSGTSTTISSISGSYKHLYVVWNKVYGSGNSDFRARFNSDSGSNYMFASIAFNTYDVSYADNYTAVALGGISTNSGDQTAYNGIMQIPRYVNGDSKFIQSFNFGKYSTTVDPRINYCNYDSSSAISSIEFLTGSAVTFSGGTVYVYGVS